MIKRHVTDTLARSTRAPFIAFLATLVVCLGCSKTSEPSKVDKETLAILEKEYKLKKYNADDEGDIIELRLEGKQVTDEALNHVVKFRMLQRLSLGWSSVTDAGMSKIQELKRLREITIVSIPITDSGLAYLENMSSLRDVWLTTSDKLTKKGIDFLKEAVPRVRIHDMNKPAQPKSN